MLDAIALGVLAGKQAVIDEIRREQFLQRLQVARGLRLQEAAHQGLVLLSGRHGVCSLQPSCAMESSYRSRIRHLTEKEYSRPIHPSAWKVNSPYYQTKEWTPLQPGYYEKKYYVRGVGPLGNPGDQALLDVKH